MAQGFGLDPGEMARVTSRVTDAHGTLNSTLNRLYSELEILLAKWQGDSAQAFTRVRESFRSQGNQILGNLEEMNNKISEVSGHNVALQEEEKAKMDNLGGHITEKLGG